MKAQLEAMKEERNQADELEKVKADLKKLQEEKSQVDARILVLEQAEAGRTSRRMKRSRQRTISYNSSVPENFAKKEVPRLSDQETNFRKAEFDRKRQESVFNRRDVQFVRGPDL